MAPLHRRSPNMIVLATVGFILSEASLARADEGEPVTLKAITRSWDARQEYAKTLDFSGQGTQSLQARTIGVDEATGPTDDKAKVEAFSVPVSTFNARVRFIADDKGRLRQESVEKQLDYKKKEYIRHSIIEIAKDDRLVIHMPESNLEFPIATIRRAKPSAVSKPPAALPIWMVYRWRASGIFGPGEPTLTHDKNPVGGRASIKLKYADVVVWIDPERDFVPTRYHRIVRGVTVQAFDIQYIHDAQHGWVPSAWTVARNDRTGNPFAIINMNMKLYRINLPIGDEAFVSGFEPGTWVNDEIDRETYIILKNGARRPIKRGEYNGRNYKQLLEQDPNP
jgi:hypothetical protein